MGGAAAQGVGRTGAFLGPDFFIASAPGWESPETWASQARSDVAGILQGLDRDFLAAAQILEVGCGVGRLVPFLAPLSAGYTGFDIAPGMIEEAKARCREFPGARFFASDGLGVPEEAHDRNYEPGPGPGGLHPLSARGDRSTGARSVYEVLAPGGQFRFQVFTDYRDCASFSDYRDLEATPSS